MSSAVAASLIGVLGPAILTGIGGQRKPMEYSSGLSPQDQSFQNWIRQQIQQKSAQGPSPNTMNAQSLLYNRFFGGMPQNMTGQPQQQPNVAGALPNLLQQQFRTQQYPRA